MRSGSDMQAQDAEDFSFRKVAHLLKSYTPPPIAGFDPAGKWKQDYTMYVLQPNAGVKKGEFSLERAAKGTGNFALTVRTRRIGNSGFSQFQHAEIQCRFNALASPLSWVFDTRMARNAQDPPYLDSGRRHSADVTGGVLRVRDKLQTRKEAIDGLYSNEWTLLEAVQRLPGQSMKAINYTLIDEYDTPQPNHTLAYRTHAQVALQSGPAQLVGYYDLGRAVVPTVYWVDEHGRLTFVCTGLMVYALAATNGQAGQCPDHYPAFRAEARVTPD